MLYRQFITFACIGAVNTILDAAIFYGLRSAGVPLLIAVIISTSCGLALSLGLNRRFTFKGASDVAIVRFVIITLSGLWLLQPAAIYSLSMLFGSDQPEIQVVFKLLASALTMVWNFSLYRLTVFRMPH